MNSESERSAFSFCGSRSCDSKACSNMHQLLKVVFLSTMIVLVFLVISQTYSTPLEFLQRSITSVSALRQGQQDEKHMSLEKVLKSAAMENKTVILTNLNQAWIEQDSIFDLFLMSFKLGNQTAWLLKHLVVLCFDQKAFEYCSETNLHCYFLKTEGVNLSSEANFMTPNYLEIVFRKIDLLRNVLQLGYNFLFTDADIMWFRNPFSHFFSDSEFQLACDHFGGNSSKIDNSANTGLMYVKSTQRTIHFFKLWYGAREYYPRWHDQDVFNWVKFTPVVKEIGLEIKFLNTAYFGGFCEPSKNLNLVCTMHANCCIGLENKIHDLKILLEDWRNYLALPPSRRQLQPPSWSPRRCG